jgi:aminoglycoside 3-N-acetyltransferase
MSSSLPVTSSAIAAGARGLGVERGDLLLAHVSLSSIAAEGSMVVGGPVGVIEGLLEAIGDEGTLVMPAFSADYSDPGSWESPPAPDAWLPVIREAMPAWRADRAPTFRIGVVAETFRGFREARRSDHPQSSFTARGPLAPSIVDDVGLDDPLGPDGCLGRLRARGAKVLLIGCGFGSCTAFHLAEHERTRPPARVTSAAPVIRGGTRAWVRWSEPRYDASSFAIAGQAFIAHGGCRSGAIGEAESHLFELADAVRYATGWMDRRPR